MKLKEITRGIEGKHLSVYTLVYENKNGRKKRYEMVSRDSSITRLDDLRNPFPDAVVIVAFNEKFDKILLEKEFRLPVGDYIYNFPAGLMEDGELAKYSAERELDEETGAKILRYINVLPSAYTMAGITNELTKLVICVATEETHGHPEPDEEIEAGWYTKEQVQKMLAREKFSSRTQLFCYLWAYGYLDTSRWENQ